MKDLPETKFALLQHGVGFSLLMTNCEYRVYSSFSKVDPEYRFNINDYGSELEASVDEVR